MTAQSIFEEAFGRPDAGRNDKNEEASLTGTVEEVIFSQSSHHLLWREHSQGFLVWHLVGGGS